MNYVFATIIVFLILTMLFAIPAKWLVDAEDGYKGFFGLLGTIGAAFFFALFLLTLAIAVVGLLNQ